MTMFSRRSLMLATAALQLGCARGEGWNGFRYFTAGDRAGKPLVIAPVGPKGLYDWLTALVVDPLVARGFHVVGIHLPGKDGGAEDYGARYGVIEPWLKHLGISRPALYAQSRGGLQLLNFACDNPDAFSRIAALYPVTDPLVYPGDREKLRKSHGDVDLSSFTPNAKAAALRGKAIKIWHGDKDTLVPKESTTDLFARACGAEVVTLANVGHVRIWLPAIADYLAAA